ncbi:putative adenylylsulfatase [Medicago truncatula]|uniref:Putative adenylylsulfatase n=1 Tax=Medicago truncatula TaxID=3880 RepID=G7I746_MEDTR|nr:transcription factor bHLH140 [Medicago truncatula]AES59709.2 transcription factor bHLH140-like protein [Medicago truncatula]RHN77595.1 putative adenylylsulfatase [Medicago truncatula]
MDMDLDNNKDAKPILVILVGAPGSGKSTFCEEVMRSSSRTWLRVCQDTIGNGKAGSKAQCLSSAARGLKDGKSVFIDRCNLNREQRSDFLKLRGESQIDIHAVVLDLPAKLCISRSVKRSGHEGNLQGGKAAAVVNRMLQSKELPKLSEGFNRITFCQSESNVKDAIDTYQKLGPLENLSHGCFGQKNPDSKIQSSIMKFLKKAEVPVDTASKENTIGDSTSQTSGKNDSLCKDMEKIPSAHDNSKLGSKDIEGQTNIPAGSCHNQVSLDDTPTLAFPSISTADFQFNHDKAADIIVEKVVEYSNKMENARLVLVDLTHRSKILSLVKSKAAEKNVDTQKFFTHVGDITRLYSTGGLRCNVIANAANWRLKPGGGGVNASIFDAAGPELESATKEKAKTVSPGNAVVVPLPSSSPLFTREGVTHVIHVLGPNMNPQRPNCLNNDYERGCKVLQDAYASLFEGFASIVRNTVHQNENLGKKSLELQDQSEQCSRNTDQKSKRDADHELEKSKKYKGTHDGFDTTFTGSRDEKVDSEHKRTDGSTKKAWGSWAQALHLIAMHPEKHKDDLLEISEDIVVLNDMYPKAQKHVLVLARSGGLDCLSDVQNEHLSVLKRMHAVGLKWAEKFLSENSSLVFRLGYHSVPSMRQLHLHVISQDFDSKHLKNKKHWNSFNTAFFRDSVDIIDEVSIHGKATLKDDDKLLSMELRCHKCKSAHPNIPRLKSHISSCQAPFPANLLENGRLVGACTK